MAFADSWKQNAVELGALGAIVLGAGHYAVHGNLSALSGGVKDSAKNVLNAFDRYVKSNGPVATFVRNIGVKGAKKLTKYPGIAAPGTTPFLDQAVLKARSQLDPKKIERIAKDDFVKDYIYGMQQHVDNKLPGQFKMENDLHYYRERARTDEVDRLTKQQQDEEARKAEAKKNGRPQSTPGRFFGAGLSGLGFGAGLTAFHGIDRLSRGKDDHGKRDRNYEVAGSFLKNKDQRNNRGGNMDKKANFATSLYDSLANVGIRTPQAIATGLGYTGVTLGTAALLKNHPELLHKPGEGGMSTDSSDHPTSPRIIIELGQDPKKSLDPHASDGYGMSPRLASDGISGLAKLATVGSFFKNVGGRHDELRTLSDRINEVNHDYRDEAAAALKGQDITKLVAERYGNLGSFQNERDLARELHDSTARANKRIDLQNQQLITDAVKRDRLLAAAGTLGLGGAGIGLAQLAHRPSGVNTNGN